MLDISVENIAGQIFDLTNNPSFTMISASGLNPVNATINTTVTGTFDGTTYKSSRATQRNIVLTFVLEEPEEARLMLYRWLCPKSKIKLYVKTNRRNVWTQGYVEALDVSLFDKKQKLQVSILCPYSYFIDVNETLVNFNVIKKLFKFPFSDPVGGMPFSEIEQNSKMNIINDGDVPSGLKINLRASGIVVNPKIYNENTGEHFFLNITMQDGDLITINTNKGEKNVLLTRNAVVSNIINTVISGSKWFEIGVGDNSFIYSADTHFTNLKCEFIHANKYGGV